MSEDNEKFEDMMEIEKLIEILTFGGKLDEILSKQEMLNLIKTQATHLKIEKMINLVNQIYVNVRKIIILLKVNRMTVYEFIKILTKNLKAEINSEMIKFKLENESKDVKKEENLDFENKFEILNGEPKEIVKSSNDFPKSRNTFINSGEKNEKFSAKEYNFYLKSNKIEENFSSTQTDYEATVCPTNNFSRIEIFSSSKKLSDKKTNLLNGKIYPNLKNFSNFKSQIDEIVLPINPKKSQQLIQKENNHEETSSLCFKKKKMNIPEKSVRNADICKLSLNSPKNMINNSKLNQIISDKTQPINLNIKQMTYLNEEDFFFQVFRNASNQNKNLQMFTNKIYNISRKNVSPKMVEIENKITSPKNSKNILNLDENNKIIHFIKQIRTELTETNLTEPEEKKENFIVNNLQDLSNTNYNIKNTNEKEKYLQSIKNNIKEFINKKTEFKKKREDHFLYLDAKLNDIIQHRRNTEDPPNLNIEANEVYKITEIKENFNDMNENNSNRNKILFKIHNFIQEEQLINQEEILEFEEKDTEVQNISSEKIKSEGIKEEYSNFEMKSEKTNGNYNINLKSTPKKTDEIE